MMLQRVKTVALGVLVALSIVLSYELWQGLWSTPATAAWSGPSGLVPTKQPTLKQVIRPSQVVYRIGQPAKYSVGLPTSTPYNAVLALLQIAHVSKSRTVAQWQPSGLFAVEVDFGIPLTRTQLQTWMPSVQGLPAGTTVGTMWLSATSAQQNVQIVMQTDVGYSIATTDLQAASFRESVASSVAKQPWSQVNKTSYVPSRPIRVSRQVWTTTSPQVLPLVRSFFVNPQVLTRVNGPNHTVIWTDGSRAVQWDQSSGTLAFSDPNASVNIDNSSALPAIVKYLQSHGGTPGSVIALQNVVSTDFPQGDTYTFRPFMNGLPLLGDAGSYTVEWIGGSTVGFQRPLIQLGTLVKSEEANTLSKEDLMNVVNHLVAPSLQKSMQIQLACVLEPAANGRTQVEPVFEVTQENQALLRIDAVTGQVFKGGVSQ